MSGGEVDYLERARSSVHALAEIVDALGGAAPAELVNSITMQTMALALIAVAESLKDINNTLCAYLPGRVT